MLAHPAASRQIAEAGEQPGGAAAAGHAGPPGCRCRGPSRAGRVTSGGSIGSGEEHHRVTVADRQRQPELGALARSTPGVQPAAVQPGVLQADRQPEAGPAGAPVAGRVGAPEAVEDQRGLAGPQARRRGRGRSPRPRRSSPRRRDLDRPALAVLHRVDHAGCAGSARPGGRRRPRPPARPAGRRGSSHRRPARATASVGPDRSCGPGRAGRPDRARARRRARRTG